MLQSSVGSDYDDDELEAGMGTLAGVGSPFHYDIDRHFAGLSVRVDVGETCVVHATPDQHPELFTGKPLYWCCVMWGFESLPLPNGTLVEVVDVEPTDPSVVTVRVFRCLSMPAIENMIGTVRASWLQREYKEEALADGIQISAPPAFVPNRMGKLSSVVEEPQGDIHEEQLDVGAIEPTERDSLLASVPSLFDPNNPPSSAKVNKHATPRKKHSARRRHKKGMEHEMSAPVQSPDAAATAPPAHNTLGDRIKSILHLSTPNSTPQQSPMPAPAPARLTEDDKQDLNGFSLAAQTNPHPHGNVTIALPSGMQTEKRLLRYQSLFERGLVQFTDIFPLCTDGKRRTLPGRLLRGLSSHVEAKRFQKLSFLTPLRDAMVDMSSDGRGKVVFNMNFGKDQTKTVESPKQCKLVLQSGFAADPYLVHPDNKPLTIFTEVRKFVVKNKVTFFVSDKGIESINGGDLHVKVGFKFETGVRTVHHFRRIEYDSKQRPFLRTDKHGRPLIHDGHYVPHTYDDWMVLTVLRNETWIGMPPLSMTPEDARKYDDYHTIKVPS